MRGPLRLASALLLLMAVAPACQEEREPLRIAVLLPISGAGDVGWRQPLEWARDNINRAGGVAGRRLELSYQDLATVPVEQAVAQANADDSIVAAIGPDTSPGMFQIAPAFLQARKPLVSPSATAGQILRAFSGKKYVWRTVGSDLNQVQSMLLLAVHDGAKKVALLAANDEYGGTFSDWFGFFATELGLGVTNVIRRDESNSDCSGDVAQALAGQPDAMLVAPSLASAAICEARVARQVSPRTQLIFSDSARFPAFVDELGQVAEGLAGTSPASDPTTGFAVAYRVLFGGEPPAYAANAYDALCLLAYGLERSGGEGGEKLAQALAEVVDARGAATGWDREGIADALAAIRAGNLPDLRGAASLFNFNKDAYVEPITTTYARWHIEAGAYVDTAFVSTSDSKWTMSLGGVLASASAKQALDNTGTYQPGPKTGRWALVVATSRGWENYRHQADALAQYQLLRAGGLADDHIVFVLADDLANNPANTEPGVVRNVAGGPNLYHDLQIDYRLADLTAGDLMAILSGQRSARLPTVIESTAGDDVYVFWVGHGGSMGALVNASNSDFSKEASATFLDPFMLQDTLQTMFTGQRYRRLLMVVEACEAGVLGAHLDATGAVLLTGANPTESSFGANYDPSQGAWLADGFAYEYFLRATSASDITLDALYSELYFAVPGSHVSVYNSHGFGPMANVSLGEFIK